MTSSEMFEKFIGHCWKKKPRVRPLTKDLREKLRRNIGRTVKINDSNGERRKKNNEEKEREKEVVERDD